MDKNADLNLYQKLAELRKAIPYMQKDTQGFNYKYTKGVDILNVIKPEMEKLGLLLIPSISSKSCGTFKDLVKGKEKIVRFTEGEMIYTWIDTHSGVKLEVPFSYFGEQDDFSKAFGSALTYSERYFLMKFFQIETDEADPDAKQKEKESKASKLLEEKRIALFNYAKQKVGLSKTRLDANDKAILTQWYIDNFKLNSLVDASCEEVEKLYKKVVNK